MVKSLVKAADYTQRLKALSFCPGDPQRTQELMIEHSARQEELLALADALSNAEYLEDLIKADYEHERS